MCMGGCGKSSAGKSNSYTPKSKSGKSSTPSYSKSSGGYRSTGGAGSFGTPRVKFSGRRGS